MDRARGRILGLAMALALALAAGPNPVSAQSTLDASQAQEFLGHWLVNFDSGQGVFVVELEIADEDGKVAATVTTIQMGAQDVTDISRSEDTLTFDLMADAQGQLIPIRVVLKPNGENLDVVLDIAQGQMLVEGVGSRMTS